MAVTVTFNEYNGAGQTQTAGITELVFGAYDGSGFTAHLYPLHAGSNSFVKYVKAAFAGFAGETVSEAKIHMSTSLGTGDAIVYEGLGPVSYATPTRDATGDSAIPTSTPASQNLALGDADDGSLTADGESNFMRLQRQLSATAEHGTLKSATIVLTYTEA